MTDDRPTDRRHESHVLCQYGDRFIVADCWHPQVTAALVRAVLEQNEET